MVFGIPMSIGQGVLCPCCKDHLWHCKNCWEKWHNGRQHKDYKPPEYYGQSMMSKDVHENGIKELNIDFMENVKIKPSKERPYQEGIYMH